MQGEVFRVKQKEENVNDGRADRRGAGGEGTQASGGGAWSIGDIKPIPGRAAALGSIATEVI
jgi:hypothetical protein